MAATTAFQSGKAAAQEAAVEIGKVGRKAEAKVAYERVVSSQANGIERALALPEAKEKAESL